MGRIENIWIPSSCSWGWGWDVIFCPFQRVEAQFLQTKEITAMIPVYIQKIENSLLFELNSSRPTCLE